MLDLALEGTVVAVAADRGHHFSKRQQGSIVLVEEHGVEGDAHAGAFVRHRYLARRRPRFPNLRQVHLIPRELFDTLGELCAAAAAMDSTLSRAGHRPTGGGQAAHVTSETADQAAGAALSSPAGNLCLRSSAQPAFTIDW